MLHFNKKKVIKFWILSRLILHRTDNSINTLLEAYWDFLSALTNLPWTSDFSLLIITFTYLPQSSGTLPVYLTPPPHRPFPTSIPELRQKRRVLNVVQVWRTRSNRLSSLTDVFSGVSQVSVVIELSFVSQVCQLWALNVKLQYCNVNTHTKTISGLCFFFIGKDIQVFLVFRISAFCSWTCWTGIINTKGILSLRWWSLHYVHFCWILNCQNVSKFSRDKSTYCIERSNHWHCQDVDTTILEIGSPQTDTGKFIKQ